MAKDGDFSPSAKWEDTKLAHEMVATFKKGGIPVLCCLPTRVNALVKIIKKELSKEDQALFQKPWLCFVLVQLSL